MSQQAVSEVLIKALIDKDFREALFNQPVKALAGLDLTELEVSTLGKIDRVVFDKAASELESRLQDAGKDLSSLDVVMILCNAIIGMPFVKALNLGELLGK